jgi:uncharacterized protein YydD (DUF2326 family)
MTSIEDKRNEEIREALDPSLEHGLLDRYIAVRQMHRRLTAEMRELERRIENVREAEATRTSLPTRQEVALDRLAHLLADVIKRQYREGKLPKDAD